MNLYISGQKAFGQETLKLLLQLGHNVVGVSAPLETADGRPDRLAHNASVLGIPLLPAGQLRASTLPDGVELIVCAHSHDFISRQTRHKTKLGAIGYHPSLLPLHRGRDAVRWTIRMRERITGGSVYWLNNVVDGGPLAAQDFCFVRADDTPESLWRRELFPLGLRLFRQVLADIERGVLVKIPQDAKLATWEPGLNPPALSRPDLPQLMPPGYVSEFQTVVARHDTKSNGWGTSTRFDGF